MLRMDPVSVVHPESVNAALALLEVHGDRARVCAGGTDLVPNLKHGLHEPDVIVHLSRVPSLRGIHESETHIEIGALTTLHEIAHDPRVARHAPGLTDAAGLVAGPQLRRMGTLGGNLCLDTRCLYYNQSHFWREALGFCLKKDGTQCHVVASGKNCVAAASNDTATMLLCLDAEVEVQHAQGARRLSLDEFYVADGVHNTVLTPRDLLTRVWVPKARAGTRRLEGYAKLRHRQSIDYPLLSVGARVDLDAAGIVTDARLVVSALAARPKSVPVAFALGRSFDDSLIDEMAAVAFKKCTPLTNIADDPKWRRDMVPVFVKRALLAARARA